jgi:hypothetical protein
MRAQRLGDLAHQQARGEVIRELAHPQQRWRLTTSVLPARLETRVDRSLPRGLSLRSIVEGAEVRR